MQDGNALKELTKEFHENRLAHAFLLETNQPEKCFKNLVIFLKMLNCPSSYQENCVECNLCHLFDSSNLPSLVVVEKDGTSIKKEQILSLKQFFQTKPLYSKYNMYIVKEAECLNASSANTMLKFIEEPEDHIIGFFITNNKENIIDTIRSRCQIIKDYYDSNDEVVPQVWKDIALSYLKELLERPTEGLLYNKEVLLPLIHDRKELNYLFQCILDVYQDCYLRVLNHNELDGRLQFLENKGKIFYQKQICYLVSLMNKLNYNLNVSLVLDCFVLEGSEF